MKIVSTNNAPAAIGPYSQATIHNNVLYVSGQLPIDPASGELITGDIKNQVKQVMQNLKAIVEAANGQMQNVLKTTILLVDMSHFAAVNEVYASYFPTNPPARICYQVCGLPKGAEVEIDAICALD